MPLNCFIIFLSCAYVRPVAQASFTLAISFFTVFDGWAPLAIHAWAFIRSIFTVGGEVSGL